LVLSLVFVAIDFIFKGIHMVNPQLLIVDDHPEIGELIEAALEHNDVNCTIAYNLEEAKQYLKSMRFDLVLLDVRLPDGDGIEFAGEIRDIVQEKISPPIIFLTIKSDLATRLDAYQLFTLDYIIKPFSIRELRLKILNLLGLIETYSLNAEPSVDRRNDFDQKTLNVKKDKMYRIMEICEKNISNSDFTIDCLAKEMNSSVRTIQRFLQQKHQTNFSEIFKKCKMEKAKLYLEKGFQIKRVSTLCGYNRVENFSLAFKGKYGKTPNEYKT